MKKVAQWLIAEELRAGEREDTKSRAAFRVCEKLRRPLAGWMGVAGFRSLLARALTLATATVPWLEGMKIDGEGRLEFPVGGETEVPEDEAVQGVSALIVQLLELLVTFIGEPLTLRLVQDVWPKAALEPAESEKDQL